MFIAIRERLDEREEGFTLIELLVVVIIIGILAAIAIPVFLRQRERAWAASIQSDLRNSAIVVETYYTEAVPNAYPVSNAAFRAMPDFQESNRVTLEYDLKAGNQAYCITGLHADLDNGAVQYSYDSDGGGVVPGDVC